MAGRPAPSRGGGLTGLHYGLIFFVFVSLAALGGFVFQLTKVKEAVARADRAESRLDKFGTPPSYYDDESARLNRKTFDVMENDLNRVATRVVGQEAVGKAVAERVDAVVRKVAGDFPDLVNPADPLAVTTLALHQALTTEQANNEAMRMAIVDQQEQIDTLTTQLKTVRDEFEAEVERLGEQVRLAREEKDESIERKDEQLQGLQDALTTAEQELQDLTRERLQDAREFQLEIERRGNQLADLQRKLQERKGQTLDPDAILTQADGRIIRVVPGSEIAYINLGRADQLKVGMGFEVFSQAAAPATDFRGKASLEVITLMENTAECRIVRTEPAEPILAGDIVVNVAFARNRQPKFYVIGQFDLNYDGLVDDYGKQDVEGLVRQWGGQVVDELDETTDFVVIGSAPGIPAFAPGQTISDQVRELARDREFANSAFRDIIERARSMYIPVINQHQFLFLTGYAGEPLVMRR